MNVEQKYKNYFIDVVVKVIKFISAPSIVPLEHFFIYNEQDNQVGMVVFKLSVDCYLSDNNKTMTFDYPALFNI